MKRIIKISLLILGIFIIAGTTFASDESVKERFIWNGIAFFGETEQDLVDMLGKPIKVEPGWKGECIHDWDQVIYYKYFSYPGLYVKLFTKCIDDTVSPNNEGYYIYGYYVTEDRYVFNGSLQVGSSKILITDYLGRPDEVEGDVLKYFDNSGYGSVEFTLVNDIVTKIQFIVYWD